MGSLQGPSPSSDGRTDTASLMCSFFSPSRCSSLSKKIFNTFHRGSNHLNFQLEPRDSLSLSYADNNSPTTLMIQIQIDVSRGLVAAGARRRRGWCPLWVGAGLSAGCGRDLRIFSRDHFSLSRSFQTQSC